VVGLGTTAALVGGDASVEEDEDEPDLIAAK
jgi:hypothetical protein